MRDDRIFLAQTDLFTGIPPDELPRLLDCIHAKRVNYRKGEWIIEEGSGVYDFGIVLSGHGRSVKWDEADKLIILTLLEPGAEIGVLLAASRSHRSPVAVQAEEDMSVLQIPFERVWSRCPNACPHHDRFLRNYMYIVAEKGLVLHERIDCLLKSTVREKIETYLLRISRESQSRFFTIPMDRNAMAAYLNIERSALSRELSHMKSDGLIDYHKNSFRLL